MKSCIGYFSWKALDNSKRLIIMDLACLGVHTFTILVLQEM